MAIKGKTKSRSRRVVAIPPRPPVYVRKPPIHRRRVTWIVLAILVVAAVTPPLLVARSHRHRDALKAAALDAVEIFQTKLNNTFPPSPDSRPAQPTGYIVYPTLSADLTDIESGKTSATDADKKGKSLESSAKASATAAQALNVVGVIPESASFGEVPSVHGTGATRLVMTDARNLITQAFQVYSAIGYLMQQAGKTTTDTDRKAVIAEARTLFTQAQNLFNTGYTKVTNVEGQLETLPVNPFPQTSGGLGG